MKPLEPSDHCDGRRYFNPGLDPNRSWMDVLRWKLHSRPAVWPDKVAPVSASLPPAPQGEGVAATFIGHASWLLRGGGLSLLTDPVFSARIGPFGGFGPRRVQAPGLSFEQLPPIDAVLLSHDHYDHCDLPSLKRLATAFDPLVIAPLGHARLLRRAGLRRVLELDWWQQAAPLPGLTLRAVPALHWSNRLSGRRNGRLWCGFELRLGERSLYFAGDTGFDETLFRELSQRLQPPDLAFIPIGAYEPRWFMALQHCNPAEAVAIHRILGARRSLGMHWGTWQLTDEAREAPVLALNEALTRAGIAPELFRAPEAGSSVTI